MSESDAPGWDAIDSALNALYPGQEPRHVGYPPGLSFGAGLQGCSAYAAEGHWHYVTYGLTELWHKDPEAEPEVSGWGYELTFRLARELGEAAAPEWPFGLLEMIARHTRKEQRPFWVGDRLNTGGPINRHDDSTALVALAFTLDPTLSPRTSPNGRFEFRQCVGITEAELSEMKAADTDQVLARFRETNPLLITDMRRGG